MARFPVSRRMDQAFTVDLSQGAKKQTSVLKLSSKMKGIDFLRLTNGICLYKFRLFKKENVQILKQFYRDIFYDRRDPIKFFLYIFLFSIYDLYISRFFSIYIFELNEKGPCCGPVTYKMRV